MTTFLGIYEIVMEVGPVDVNLNTVLELESPAGDDGAGVVISGALVLGTIRNATPEPPAPPVPLPKFQPPCPP